ncbi:MULTISPECIES: hypothetical protein [unclassified Moorena]|uniref:hypothetical protein n=1 Tax=unclassified Moorena TaxID=2683338 RepID=UPI0025FC3CBA|nr:MULTISPECIES: hypothetical protein [unclassified Moorena]
MFSDSNRRRELIQEIADLMEEEEACRRQYRAAIDEAERVRLKRKLNNLYQQITDKDNQLKQKDSIQNANRRFLALEDKLSKLDFKEQIKLIKNIFDEFEENGLALFFINESLNMAGDLLCLEIQNLLKDETTDLQHYEIAFSVDRRLDEVGFLQGLGGYLGINEIKGKDEYLKIIEKFSELIKNGSIIFIELKKIDLLDNQANFLEWLVNFFWKSLIEKVPLICKNQDIEQVKFIIVVVSDDNISDECSNLSFFCNERCFDKTKFLAIPLKEWTEKEIRLWLTKYSRLSKNIISPMAKSVYKSSRGGTPKLICDALRNKLS